MYSHIFCSVLGMFCQISGVAFGMYGHILSIVSVVYSHFFKNVLGMYRQISGFAFGMYGYIFSIALGVYSHNFVTFWVFIVI